jgi:hypothetical protein
MMREVPEFILLLLVAVFTLWLFDTKFAMRQIVLSNNKKCYVSQILCYGAVDNVSSNSPYIPEVLGRTNRLLFFYVTWTTKKTRLPTILRCHMKVLPRNDRGYRETRPTTLLFLRVFLTAGTCLPRRCLATIGEIHIQTHRLMGGIYEVHR